MNDSEYMRMAIELAKRGCGYTSPNPMVGAVIVKDGKVIGQGWHEKYGELHAERNALISCKVSPKGATMYVTLEPCCHYGKQPPCTDAVIESGIKRVVVGSGDPNPLVAGKGIKILREHGIEVEENVLKEECDKHNEIFLHYIRTGLPFTVMKYAMTADGKIATRMGKSKWITGEAARGYVHKQRHKFSAIMVGSGTVIADDPLLTCRIPNGKNPLRVVCDSRLITPFESKIVKTANEVKTIIATCCNDRDKISEYEKTGCRVMNIPERNGHIDLSVLMKRLGEDKIDSILLEGGSTLNWSALESGIADKAQIYIAPKLFGGESAKTPIGGMGVEIPDSAFRLKNTEIIRIGDDFLIEGEVEK